MRLTIMLVVVLAFSACVDDFTDYQPARALDAPTLRVSGTSSRHLTTTVSINPFQNTPVAYVLYGEPVTFEVSVIDAPGKVADVTISSAIEEFATVELNEASVTQLQGSETGTFSFTVIPAADLPDMADRTTNISITVSDGQEGENSRSTTVTLPVTLTTGCFSTGIVPGNYQVSEASGNIDAGAGYTIDDLVDVSGEFPTVTITQDRPGLYTLNEVTAGIWPLFYPGRANPVVKFDLCGNAISGHAEATTAGGGTVNERVFTLNGTLNEDGSITINWSYVRTAGTPANPAQGSYTLTRIAL